MPKKLLSWCCVPGAAAMIAALAAPALSAAASDPTPPTTPSCAWIEYNTSTIDAATGSVPGSGGPALPAPDNSATYWLIPFTVQPGLQIKLDGTFPAARYASFQVYTSTGALFTNNGVSSGLTDYLIQPDPGSINPWQQPTWQLPAWTHQAWGLPRKHAAWGRPGRHFTVTVSSDVAPGETNTLPLVPAGTAAGATGYLVYRVFLPARNDFSRVPLPTVTFSLNGVSTVVPACPPAPVITPAPAAAPVPAGTSTPGPSAVSVPFSRLGAGGGFPNNDSGYLAAVLTPPTNGDVLVIHAKAPTATQGNDPVPWPTRGIDMRYWSLCGYLASTGDPEVANLLPNGRVDYGCRNNSQTQIDRQGYYTWVVGTEAQRAQIDRIPDATFVPFSSSKPTAAHIFLVRNMLVNPSFGQSILGVPGGSSAATAQQDMGAYYPVAALCPPSSLHGYSGIATCLADASAPA